MEDMRTAMILYNLKCSQHHVFEAWFKDSATFDEQVANGEVTCPLCGDGNVRKALMAPNISTRRESRPAAPAEEASMPDAGTEGGAAPGVAAPLAQMAQSEKLAAAQAELMRALRRMRREIEETCDHVGDRFAEEARKIHYGEAEARGIYGQATREEAQELAEEGIDFAAIPWIAREDS